MDYNKKEIIELLEKRNKAFVNWYLDRPIEAMEITPDGAWSAGQHLLHLIKSTKPLAVGAGYPIILLRLKFGKAPAQVSDYDRLIERYRSAIANGGKATGDFVPRKVAKEERELLIGRLRKEVSILVNNLHKWSEKNLDNTAVPHPLLGKISFREMLYFTAYHTEHHLRILEERYK